MKLLDRAALDARPSTETGCARIVLGGQSIEVEGLVIEAAIALEPGDAAAGYLLFLTHDRPFEETLSITMLSPTLDVLDTARIERAYTPGLFSDLRIIGAATLQFRFIGETPWRLQVLDRPVLRLPFVSEPAGVARGVALVRRFKLNHGAASA